MWVYMCSHTCAWGPAPSSLKLNGRQPAVKLDCLSPSGGLSPLKWKKGERSGPKALLVEAHFEAFKVWHTLTYCQKHNDLQTAIVSIKKVWQSHSIGSHTQSHTPIKSNKQWLSFFIWTPPFGTNSKTCCSNSSKPIHLIAWHRGDKTFCYSVTMMFGVRL